jgi:hypothetical protein
VECIGRVSFENSPEQLYGFLNIPTVPTICATKEVPTPTAMPIGKVFGEQLVESRFGRVLNLAVVKEAHR